MTKQFKTPSVPAEIRNNHLPSKSIEHLSRDARIVKVPTMVHLQVGSCIFTTRQTISKGQMIWVTFLKSYCLTAARYRLLETTDPDYVIPDSRIATYQDVRDV